MTSVSVGQAILDAAPGGILLCDAVGRITYVNSRFSSLFGYAPAELVGQMVEILLPEALRHEFLARRRAYARHPATRPMGLGLDLVGRRKDGSEFPAEISLNPLFDGNGSETLAVVRDVTVHRRREQDREQLQQQLEVERERYRIGMDLHDSIMQSLFAAGLKLELIGDDLDEDSPARLDVDRVIDDLHDVVRDIRSFHLRLGAS